MFKNRYVYLYVYLYGSVNDSKISTFYHGLNTQSREPMRKLMIISVERVA